MNNLLMKVGLLLLGLAAVGYLLILVDASLKSDTAAGLIVLLVLAGSALLKMSDRIRAASTASSASVAVATSLV